MTLTLPHSLLVALPVIHYGRELIPCTHADHVTQALLQKQGAVDGGTDRLGCGAGPIPSAQRQAERAHLAAFMSRRLVL